MSCDSLEYFDESHCWLGGPQTGKTRAIVSHACPLARLSEKAETHHKPAVLLLCATPAGQAEAQTYIEKIFTSSKQSLRVELVRNIALEIMSEPEACALFGRKPRVLDEFEERFLLEDIRTTRFKGRRIRDVMEFLRGGWSRLSDDDDTWLITLEEEAIANTLRDNLRFTGGIMACELGNLAVNTLRAHAEVKERHAAMHVLVDDYSLLDRASQVLVRMLADTSFSFSGDLCPTPLTFDDFPYPEGIDEFLKAHPQTTVHKLENSFQPASLTQTLSRLQSQSEQLLKAQTHKRKSFSARYAEMMKQQKRPDETPTQLKDEATRAAASDTCDDESCPHASSSSTQQATEKCEDTQRSEQQADTTPCLDVHTEATLSDEFHTIVQICRQAIRSGEDVLVIGAHKLWRKWLLNELRRANISVLPEEHIGIRDFRDEQGCARARSKTIARLKDNPHDGVAWRSLVGFGDYMAQSAGLEVVRKAAQRQGLGIEEALAKLAEGTLEGVDNTDTLCKPLADAYKQSLEVLSSSNAQEKADKPHDSEKLAHDSSPQDPSFGHGAGRVMLCAPRDAVGIQAPTVIFGGFVNGIIPSRANIDAGGSLKEVPPRKQAEDLLLIRAVIGRASKRMIITSFLHCELEEAERIGLGISRIKLRRGMRVCAIQPSDYLDTLIEHEKR